MEMPSLSLKKHTRQVQHQQQRSQQGSDEDTNLITLCAECHHNSMAAVVKIIG
jgi:cytochrome c553